MSVRVGIDVGGTFTDLALFDGEAGTVTVTKAASTPQDPTLGVTAVIAKADVDNARIRDLCTARRSATNALLERKKRRLPGAHRDPRLPRRRVHPADEPQAPLRPDLGQAAAVRRASALPRGRRALRLPGSASSSRSTRTGARRSSASFVTQVSATSRSGSSSRTSIPTHELRMREIIAEEYPDGDGLAVARGLPALARVRPHEHDPRRRLPEDARRELHRQCRRRPRRGSGVDANFLIMKSNGGLDDHRAAAAKPIDLLVSGPSAACSARSTSDA